MNQKSSLREDLKFVSWMLTENESVRRPSPRIVCRLERTSDLELGGQPKLSDTRRLAVVIASHYCIIPYLDNHRTYAFRKALLRSPI